MGGWLNGCVSIRVKCGVTSSSSTGQTLSAGSCHSLLQQKLLA